MEILKVDLNNGVSNEGNSSTALITLMLSTFNLFYLKNKNIVNI